MYHPRLYGSYYDMGLKYGTLLYEKAGFVIPEINAEKKAFGLASFQELKLFYPEIIDEIKGFAEGIQDTPENLAAFLLSIGVLDGTAQCSVFAYRNSKRTLMGRNYDMLYAFKKFTESSLVVPTNKFASISQSDVFIGRVDGVNEKGLGIAMSFVNGRTIQPGVHFYFIVRKVLEDCATVTEAIELILSANVSTATNFIVADKLGDMAVVESAPEQKMVRRSKSNFISITNQFQLVEMKAFDRGGVGWSKSAERYASIEERLSRLNALDMEKGKEILADKCVCLDLKKEKFGTIWSTIIDLNNLQIERAEGRPKKTNFKVDNRLDWWMNKKMKKA